MSPSERPREKLAKLGATNLSDKELLAVLLHTGIKDRSVLNLAEDVLKKYEGKGILSILHMPFTELSEIKGIGQAKAATILAAVELGRRLSIAANKRTEPVKTPRDVANYAMPYFRHLDKEHFAIVLLDTKYHITHLATISVGILDKSLVHPREVFKEALHFSAAAIILIHNHPSGDVTPSKDDLILTKKMMAAGEVMGIAVLDHIILGDNKFISLKRENMLE